VAYYQGDHHQGDYYQGDYYAGDPFLGALIGMGASWLGRKLLGRGAKAAGTQAIARVGAAAGTGLVTGTVAGVGMGLIPKIARTVGSIWQGPSQGIPPLGQVGRPMFTNGVTAAAGCCPSGYHLAKDGSGRCVRNRSMNVANPRALRRSLRRVAGFGKLAMRAKKDVRRAAKSLGA